VPSSPSVMHAMYPLVASGDSSQEDQHQSHCDIPHSGNNNNNTVTL